MLLPPSISPSPLSMASLCLPEIVTEDGLKLYIALHQNIEILYLNQTGELTRTPDDTSDQLGVLVHRVGVPIIWSSPSETICCSKRSSEGGEICQQEIERRREREREKREAINRRPSVRSKGPPRIDDGAQDLDLTKPAAQKPFIRPQFETTTEEVLKKADFWDSVSAMGDNILEDSASNNITPFKRSSNDTSERVQGTDVITPQESCTKKEKKVKIEEHNSPFTNFSD